MQGAMWLFGKTEMSNRGATLLAGYRLAREAGNDAKTSRKLAVKAMERAHAVYHKATLPELAQGAHASAKIGQLMYVYGKFGHNQVQMLYDIGVRKKNIKALIWGLSSNVVLGGVKSAPLIGIMTAVINGMMKAVGDDRDPEKMFWDGVRQQLGDRGERILRHGATGALGFDISGSLMVDPTVPRSLIELTGAIGGVLKDVDQAKEFIATGNPYRAFETILPSGPGNILKGLRERKQGAVTRKGHQVFDEENRPYKPSAGETALRMVGLRSAKRATLQARQWEQTKEQFNFRKRKTRIYQEYRAYLVSRDPEKYKQVIKDIKEFNEKLRKLGRQREIAPITRKSLRGQVRRMRKPTKRKRLQ